MSSLVIPDSLNDLVIALCADYERRRQLIEAGEASFSVIMECRYLNYRLFDAAAQVVGEHIAERFILDIGYSVGYAKTELYFMSERTYKISKQEIKQNIAKRFLLL